MKISSIFARVKKFALDRDNYGHQIGVHFQGESTYNTWIGLFCTMIVYGIVFQSLILLSGAFIDGSRQEEKVNVEKFDRMNDEAYSLRDNGIRLNLYAIVQKWSYDWKK